MRMDAAGHAEFDTSDTGTIPRDARAAAELETLRRDFPRFTIERCRPPHGGPSYYSATRRADHPDAHPYHVSRTELGELRRELAAGADRRWPA